MVKDQDERSVFSTCSTDCLTTPSESYIEMETVKSATMNAFYPHAGAEAHSVRSLWLSGDYATYITASQTRTCRKSVGLWWKNSQIPQLLPYTYKGKSLSGGQTDSMTSSLWHRRLDVIGRGHETCLSTTECFPLVCAPNLPVLASPFGTTNQDAQKLILAATAEMTEASCGWLESAQLFRLPMVLVELGACIIFIPKVWKEFVVKYKPCFRIDQTPGLWIFKKEACCTCNTTLRREL